MTQKPEIRRMFDIVEAREELMEKVHIMTQVGDEGLCALGIGCPKLSKNVLKRRSVGMVGIVSLITSAAHNLTHLDLGLRASSVDDQPLEAIGSSCCPIWVLKLRGTSITDAGLRVLGGGYCSKTIKQLDLACCPRITTTSLSYLHKMCVLEELDIEDCMLSHIQDEAISANLTLKKLCLSTQERPLIAFTKNCINLEVLTLRKRCSRDSIRAFFGHKCLQC